MPTSSASSSATSATSHLDFFVAPTQSSFLLEIMKADGSILGSFLSNASVQYGDPEEYQTMRRAQAAEFRGYIWGENGLFENLKVLNYQEYGRDLELILFQFYTNPLENLAVRLREVEYYRRKERAVGVNVVVNERNFFNGSETQRQDFLRDIIVTKLELLRKTVKRGKLDTNIELLQIDVKRLLAEWRG